MQYLPYSKRLAKLQHYSDIHKFFLQKDFFTPGKQLLFTPTAAPSASYPALSNAHQPPSSHDSTAHTTLARHVFPALLNVSYGLVGTSSVAGSHAWPIFCKCHQQKGSVMESNKPNCIYETRSPLLGQGFLEMLLCLGKVSKPSLPSALFRYRAFAPKCPLYR